MLTQRMGIKTHSLSLGFLAITFEKTNADVEVKSEQTV